MGHSGLSFDGNYNSGLPAMNYDAMMALQNQSNQSNQNL
jgi:hypothetical protein